MWRLRPTHWAHALHLWPDFAMLPRQWLYWHDVDALPQPWAAPVQIRTGWAVFAVDGSLH
jgi:hypothetical protein